MSASVSESESESRPPLGSGPKAERILLIQSPISGSGWVPRHLKKGRSSSIACQACYCGFECLPGSGSLAECLDQHHQQGR